MAASSGPDIADTGLVLALDAADFNSFKGEVTTNIVPNANVMSGWSPYSSGNDGTFTTEFGTTGYRILNRPSWNGIYQGITLPSTGTYTLSAWFRYWGGSADNNGATVYTSGGGITDVAAALDKSKVGVWQRVAMTQTYSTTSFGFYLISYGGTNAVSTWDVTMPQIEAKTYATRFTTGTRGSTVATGGGFADLTGRGNNGELVNGVRESSANLGALVFDGVDDYVNIPFNASTMNFSLAQTICMWMRPATGSNTSRRNPYNQAYGGSGTLTYETDGSINYYFGTNGGNGDPYVGRSSGFTVAANETAFISVTRNQSTNVSNWYKNGVLITSSDAGGYATTANGTSPILMGSGYAGAFLGNIYDCKVYNRALSATEIQQNFNASRRRFGI